MNQYSRNVYMQNESDTRQDIHSDKSEIKLKNSNRIVVKYPAISPDVWLFYMNREELSSEHFHSRKAINYTK